MGRVRTGTVRPRTNSIQIGFWLDGKRRWESLHVKPTKRNIAWAEGRVREITSQIERGVFDYMTWFPNSPNAPKHSDDRYIKDALEDYKTRRLKGTSKSHKRSVESHINHHLIPNFGHLRLSELTAAHIEDWLGSVEVSKSTARRVLLPLGELMKSAVANGVRSRNPLEGIRIRTAAGHKPKKRDVDPFTPEEQRKILAATDDKQIRNLIQLWFWSGLRRSEIFALKWEDIDFDNGMIHVNRAFVLGEVKETKTPSGQRSIEMMKPAREALDRQKEHTLLKRTYVFEGRSEGKPWDAATFKYHWGHILERAGVRHRGPNQCRHTFASMMLSQTVNARWANPMRVARMLGHSPGDTATLFKNYATYIEAADEADETDFQRAANEALQ